MKSVFAVIKPQKLADVTLALHKLEGPAGMTVTEVRGFGPTSAKSSSDIVRYDVADTVRETSIDLDCDDSTAKTITDKIHIQAHIGALRDGKICSWNVAAAVRISSGETGDGGV